MEASETDGLRRYGTGIEAVVKSGSHTCVRFVNGGLPYAYRTSPTRLGVHPGPYIGPRNLDPVFGRLQ